MHDRLSELVRRRPFQPFRIRLTDGVVLNFVEPNRVAVLPREVVAGWEGAFRFFRFEDI
jgi:hypothetical protein